MDNATDLSSIFRAYANAANAHDFVKIRRYLAPTIRFNNAEISQDEYLAPLDGLISGFPDWRWDAQHILFDGELVAAYIKDSGTHKGIFAGIEPTGREVVAWEFAHYRITDGQISEVWVAIDLAGIIQQIS